VYANIVEDTVAQVKNDAKEFRVYPRLQKAKQHIAKKEDKKAQVLLKKVLAIEPSHKEATEMLLTLCMKYNNVKCIENYTKMLKSPSRKAYYLANIYFSNKSYKKAYQEILKVKEAKMLSKKERYLVDLISLKSAILLEKDHASKTMLKKMKTYKDFICSQSYEEAISSLLEKKNMALAAMEIDVFISKCKVSKLSEKKRVAWIEILRDNNEIGKANALIETLSTTKTKLEQKLSLYIAQKQYAKAVTVMEGIYKIQATVKNEKKLAYLYEKSGNRGKLQMLYVSQYSKAKDPKVLKKLLYLHKETPKSLLERYYPFEGLNEKERFIFTSQLIERFENDKQYTKAVHTLDSLVKRKTLNSKEKEFIAYKYYQYKQDEKAIAIMEKLYAGSTKKEYRKKLLYMYGEKKSHQKEKERLLLSNLSTSCQESEVMMLLNMKPQTKKIEKILERYYPFKCLDNKEKSYATYRMIQSGLKNANSSKVKAWVSRLLKSKNLDDKTLLSLAQELRKHKKYSFSTKSAMRMRGKGIMATKKYRILAENAYSQKRENKALKYFKLAYKASPKNKNLVKIIADLSLKKKDKKTALKYFIKYLDKKKDSNVAIEAAYLAFDLKKRKQANRILNHIHKLTKGQALKYYRLKAKLAEVEGNAKLSKKYYKKLLHYASHDTEALHRLAILSEKDGEYKSAINYLKKMIPYVKKKFKYYAQIGYWAQKYNDDKEAVNAFENALKYKKDVKYHKALAYSAVKLKKRPLAIDNFKQALDIDNQSMDEIEKYSIKQSIKYMEDEFVGYLAIMGSNQNTVNTLPSLNNNTTGGFASFRLSYIPHAYEKRMQFYLNNSIGLEKESIKATRGSYQPSVGVSYQVTTDTTVIVAVEALVKGGDNSRDDVMARFSSKLFDDYSFQVGKDRYWYKSLYMDLAYFFSSDTYRFYGRYEHGIVRKIGYQNAIMPYASATVSLDNDNVDKTFMRHFDIGLGVSYLFWLDESQYRSHEYTGRASIEAKTPLASNINEASQLQLMFELMF
jgi:tetratricopeptide (TPR) repeat protein